jgi:hypothetical protein
MMPEKDPELARRIAEADEALPSDPYFINEDAEDEDASEEEDVYEVTVGGWIPGAGRRDTA